MGCQKLDTNFSHVLEIIHSGKRGYEEKKCVNGFYAEWRRSNPFGLKHKGYNNVVNSNSNSVASKFKFNGTELKESLGSNLYEMPLRSYDPAIARWTTIDPVVHYAMSTYNAFDNNPVTFPDPSGGDVIDIKGGVKFTGQDAIDFFKSSILSNSGNGGGDDNGGCGGKGEQPCADYTITSSEGSNSDSSFNVFDASTGMVIAGNLSEAFKMNIPNLNALDFKLLSFNPSTGYALIEAYPGQVFETGTEEALKKLKILRVSAGLLSKFGNFMSYASTLEKLIDGDYTAAANEFMSATTGIMLTSELGAAYGFAWSVGWESGRYLTNNSESYNRTFHGKYSNKYIYRALKYNWDVELDTTQIHIAVYYLKYFE